MSARQPAGRDNPRPKAAGGSGRPTPAVSAIALAALALAITLAWQSATLFRLDLAFTAAETELSFWGRGDYQPTDATRERVQRELEALLAAAPSHPEYLSLAAYHDAWLAYREDDPAAARPYALRAVHTQYLAQQSRPAYRQGWEKMVRYARRAGSTADADALGILAQKRLDAWQPN